MSTPIHTANGQGATNHAILVLLNETAESSADALNREVRVNGNVLAKSCPCAKIILAPDHDASRADGSQQHWSLPDRESSVTTTKNKQEREPRAQF